MKYIEELKPGDVFVWKNTKYLLSADFKDHGQKGTNKHMSVALDNGMCRWFSSNEIVDTVPLFYRDKDGNILLVKEHNDDNTENNNFS